MPRVIAIVGYSNSGKTRVATHLVWALSRQGFNIAAVKHCHDGHEVDRPGSDTDRLNRAGASAVVAASPGRLTHIQQVNGDIPLESIVSTFGSGIDLVVAEGFKTSAVPKVVVAAGGPPPAGLENVIAVVGDASGAYAAPAYSMESLDLLAEQVRREVIEAEPGGVSVRLVIDGVYVPLKSYPRSALAAVVRGFVSSLREVPAAPAEIEVTVRASRIAIQEEGEARNLAGFRK